MRKIIFLFFIVLLLAPSFIINTKSEEKINNAIQRRVPITIKTILIGPYFNKEIIDIQFLENLLPKNKTNVILMDETTTGVVYDLNYEFVFASQEFRIKLAKYLTSIGEEKEEENPWFYNYVLGVDWFKKEPTKIKATFYNATLVEKWLYENKEEYGGFPENGYTIMLLDMRDLPSITYKQFSSFLISRSLGFPLPEVTAHYYSVFYEDKDLGYRLRYRGFATGWGGNYRFWFIDLSAGPTFISEWFDLPIQVIMEDQGINPYTLSGSKWITELLADYIIEFIYNLALPNYVYNPQLSKNYRIELIVFDYRKLEEKEIVLIENAINIDYIKNAIKNLIPYSNISIKIEFKDLLNYPELEKTLRENTVFINSWLHRYLFISDTNTSYVDAESIYYYLKNNLNRFIHDFIRDEETYTIPVFIFAFSNNTHFYFKYKWYIQNIHPEFKSILGVALKEFVLIGVSQQDLTYGEYVSPKQEGKGIGLTQTIIHEIGHMLGLAHPFQYSDIGNFVNSTMSYFSYEYGFSLFDKDAINRAHVDNLIIKTKEKIIKIENIMKNKVESKEIEEEINYIKNLINEVENEYKRMNYIKAFNIIKNIPGEIDLLIEKAEKLPDITAPLISELKEKEIIIESLKRNITRLESEIQREKSKIEELNSIISSQKEEISILKNELESTKIEAEKLKNINYLLISIIGSLLIIIIVVIILRKRKE
ncbi:MAG: hypothetical protein QXO29_06115 [Nitrososphaerota archaeon]